MTLALAFLVAQTALGAGSASVWADAVVRANLVPEAKVELVKLEGQPATCVSPTSVEAQPIQASGRVGIRATGPGCNSKWMWAQVRVTIPALRAVREVAAGARVNADDVKLEWVELQRGQRLLTSLPEEARMKSPLARGELLSTWDVQTQPMPNSMVTVVFDAHGIVVEQPGKIVACSGGLTCASLPNGRRVRGTYKASKLYLEAGAP